MTWARLSEMKMTVSNLEPALGRHVIVWLTMKQILR